MLICVCCCNCGGYCCLVNIFGPPFWHDTLLFWCLVPSPSILVYIWKGKRSKQCETTRTKEHSKQSSTNKIKFIFQEIHEKENITNIFIIKGFRTIVFIFIVISTTFWPICPPAFFRWLLNSGTFMELRTTSFIESTGVVCSDSVSHNRVQVLSIPVLFRIELATSRWLSLKKLREPTPITITPCVLLDNSEWIFGTYKLNVLTWLELLLLCIVCWIFLCVCVDVCN